MKCTVTPSCIGCGLCTVTCPQVFCMSPEGRSQVRQETVEGADARAVKEAMTACPVNAIREVKSHALH